MTQQDLQIGPLPPLWRVLLYRISQSERRERILRDWEEHVFGFKVSGVAPGAAASATRRWPAAIDLPRRYVGCRRI